MNTLGQWLTRASEQLRDTAVSDSPELDAQLIACHSLTFTRTRLYAYPEYPLDAKATADLNELLQRRLNGEPLAYITGTREFWSIPLKVNSSTLVPRAETELLVEKALQLEADAPSGFIVDLGTGSGAIAIAVAQELNTREILAIEQSPAALQVAKENSQARTSGNMHLVNANWMDSIADHSVAMILANPPYLASDDVHLDALQHEPAQALVSGPNGLEDISYIIRQSIRTGKPGAVLIMEHGYQQAEQVRQLMHEHRLERISGERDLAGHERISIGYVSQQRDDSR